MKDGEMYVIERTTSRSKHWARFAIGAGPKVALAEAEQLTRWAKEDGIDERFRFAIYRRAEKSVREK